MYKQNFHLNHIFPGQSIHRQSLLSSHDAHGLGRSQLDTSKKDKLLLFVSALSQNINSYQDLSYSCFLWGPAILLYIQGMDKETETPGQ